MLALTRQVGQRIMIDTGKSKITIQVIRLRGKNGRCIYSANDAL